MTEKAQHGFLSSKETRGHAVPITKAERHYIVEGLRRLDAGFAQKIAAKFEATRCDDCRGSGYAPYVGGNDDDAPCLRCDGSGFKED